MGIPKWREDLGILIEKKQYKKDNLKIPKIQFVYPKDNLLIKLLFNGKIDYSEFKVGGTDRSIPDDIKLVVNLPS